MKSMGFKLGFLTLFTIISIGKVNAQSGKPYGTDDKTRPLDKRETYGKFEQLINYINEFYVDSVDAKRLVEKAITAMLEELDPHSIYIPREEVEETNMPLKGNFDGIGIRYQIFKDTIMIINTIPGGPSEKNGILAGDKIVAVDGKTVAGIGIKTPQVKEHLMGPRGSKVKVSVLRKGEKNNIDFDLTRDKIPVYSVDAAYMATKDIGYIKLSSFGATSLDEFYKSVDSLKKQGMKSLIFDLQGNSGGYLQTAERLCDEFLDGDKLMVFTQGRAYEKNEVNASVKGVFEKGKLVVLIDEGSASASEILSGAVQDWDRGIVVGRRSFGKGLVQKPVPLSDGSVARITIQRYYTPSGRCIQKSYEEGLDAYRKEKYERQDVGSNVDTSKIPDSLKFYTRINHRLVLGGGGITPDVFVPFDTSEISDYLSSLSRKGVFNNFCLTYVDKNRSKLKQDYPVFDKFKKSFVVTPELMNEFTAYAEKEGVKMDAEGFKRSERFIKIRLKATLAQDMWDPSTFYPIFNELNETYLKGIEIAQSNMFKELKVQF